MVDEEKFYENAEVVDVVGKEMTAQLKAQRDEVMTLYAKLIANPYLAPHLIPDFRSALMGTVATLMENGIPVSDNPKIRTPDDVIREGMAELAGMVGGSIAGKMMKAKQAEDGEEVDCDENGNPLED
ncbi:MAG: hypothetical protein EB156_05465 [Euryarchaeota archaeon]|nr:hypothetical protein [Euryarchaeota archaeon]